MTQTYSLEEADEQIFGDSMRDPASLMGRAWVLTLADSVQAGPTRRLDCMTDERKYTRDPATCPHKRVATKGVGGGTDDGVDTVSSDWGTCQDWRKARPQSTVRALIEVLRHRCVRAGTETSRH